MTIAETAMMTEADRDDLAEALSEILRDRFGRLPHALFLCRRAIEHGLFQRDAALVRAAFHAYLASLVIPNDVNFERFASSWKFYLPTKPAV